MKPDYNKAADELKTEGFKGQLAIIDCTENPTITEEYEISGFPTLKLFMKGKFVSDYTGSRTLTDIKNFIKEAAGKNKDEL